jgi:diacylglycerol kinase (ATP)
MLKKVRIFLSGLQFAIRHDRSVALQMLVSLIVLAVSFGLREWFDFVFILVITGYMLITEIFNSAIEAICDYVQPEHDPRIGAIKDVAAAAVGISVLIWIGALLFEVFRIITLLQGN